MKNKNYFSRAQRRHVFLFDAVPWIIAMVVIIFFPRFYPRQVDIGLMLFFWFLTGIGITVGYHRLFTHRAFQTSSTLKVLLAILGSMAAVGPTISWVATHRKHHAHSDVEGDPHSPNQCGSGFVGSLRGFFHAQFGWLAGHDFPSPYIYCRDLLKDEKIVQVNRKYIVWVFLGIFLPGLISLCWDFTLTSFILGAFWAGYFRIAVVHQIVSSVNSIGHMMGRRPYSTNDRSRNNLLIAIPTVGEGWHNNHHKFPSSAYIGLRWWEIDLGGMVVTLLSKMGLVWKVKDARRKSK